MRARARGARAKRKDFPLSQVGRRASGRRSGGSSNRQRQVRFRMNAGRKKPTSRVGQYGVLQQDTQKGMSMNSSGSRSASPGNTVSIASVGATLACGSGLATGATGGTKGITLLSVAASSSSP